MIIEVILGGSSWVAYDINVGRLIIEGGCVIGVDSKLFRRVRKEKFVSCDLCRAHSFAPSLPQRS